MCDFFDPMHGEWRGTYTLNSKSYTCAHCGNLVASDIGYIAKEFVDPSALIEEYEIPELGRIVICKHCQGPTIFDSDGNQLPCPMPGRDVTNLPEGIQGLYMESRRCVANHCYNASVLLCRKLLMHIAVEKEADPRLKFYQFIDYLNDNGYIPITGKQWVDQIRKLANFANHEIVDMNREQAEKILFFTENLLTNIYELPALGQQGQPSSK